MDDLRPSCIPLDTPRHTPMAGMARDWPAARGIWHNHDKNFMVWVNEEDHLRVIAMEKTGNIKRVFQRFCEGLTQGRYHD
jgi:hypothetical protein